MDTADSQTLPAPPNLIKSLLAGFDAVSSHLGVILFPAIMDLLLWWGPHLRIGSLVETVFKQASMLPEMDSPEMVEMFNSSRELWTSVVERLNLISLLRTYPIGIPSLMVQRSPIEAPWGSAAFVEIPSITTAVLLWLGLSVAGLVLGTLYFSAVARVSLDQDTSMGGLLKDWLRSSVQVLLLALVWLLVVMAIVLPFSCFVTIIMLTGLNLGNISILLFGILGVWLMFPLAFSPHGIFVYRQRVWESLKTGVRLVRLTFPATGLFLLLALLITLGLDTLWQVPPEQSWFSLVGVAGHAFVSSAILAASFIYYRDANRWVQEMLQRVKAKRA